MTRLTRENMTHYNFVHNPEWSQGERFGTLYKINGANRIAMPSVIGSETWLSNPSLTVSCALLLDYLGSEENLEAKVNLLARPLSLCIRRLGIDRDWCITEDELQDAILGLSIRHKEFIDELAADYAVEIVSACRRDTLRLSR